MVRRDGPVLRTSAANAPRWPLTSWLAEDWLRCSDLIETYRDLGLGLVDASLVAIAERCAQRVIATLNRPDFAVVRPDHVAAFEFIP